MAKHLQRAGLPTHVSTIPGLLPPPTKLVELMRQDKKAEGGKLTFILARAIGDTFIAKGVAEADVLSFIEKDLQRP